MLVAEADGRIIGLRAFMRWRFRTGDRMLHAVRAVDTATHPDYQGRGVFLRLTRQALEELRHDVDLVFNTPNDNSLRGYLKMGWHLVGKVPIWVRVRRPGRLVAHRRTIREAPPTSMDVPTARAGTAAAVLAKADDVASLLLRVETSDERLRTPLDVDVLRWRYAAPSFLDYRVVCEHEGEELRGLGIFRVRPRGQLLESTVAELIVPPGDGRTLRRLLRRIAGAARVDHLTCRLPVSWTPGASAFRSGLVRAPGGMTFVVNPLRPPIQPNPGVLRSWALSLGDLEVF